MRISIFLQYSLICYTSLCLFYSTLVLIKLSIFVTLQLTFFNWYLIKRDATCNSSTFNLQPVFVAMSTLLQIALRFFKNKLKNNIVFYCTIVEEKNGVGEQALTSLNVPF